MSQFEEIAAPQILRHQNDDVPALRSAPVAAPAASVLRLQRTVGNAAVAAQLSEDTDRPISKVVAGGGNPLDKSTRSSMEQAFGHDFGDVRVHDDAAATAAAADVSARAATVGNHIVFRSGEFNPGTPQRQHLLAHELTHVVQQRSGPVEGTETSGGIRVSDPSDRFEQAAEANASRITSQLTAETAAAPAAPSVGASLQRAAESGEEESEEAVQAMADSTVQREEEGESESEE